MSKRKSVTTKPTRIKITSIGSAGSGKSCLIKRLCENRFVSKYIATIGVDYGVKPHEVDGEEVRVNFWDLSGHDAFFEIRNEFYKDTQGLVIVYDVTNKESFESLDRFIGEARKFGGKKVAGVLCANKIDQRRVIPESEGRAFAKLHGLEYFETSASSGANVTEMFETVFSEALRR